MDDGIVGLGRGVVRGLLGSVAARPSLDVFLLFLLRRQRRCQARRRRARRSVVGVAGSMPPPRLLRFTSVLASYQRAFETLPSLVCQVRRRVAMV